jgi:hypothetical protein
MLYHPRCQGKYIPSPLLAFLQVTIRQCKRILINDAISWYLIKFRYGIVFKVSLHGVRHVVGYLNFS